MEGTECSEIKITKKLKKSKENERKWKKLRKENINFYKSVIFFRYLHWKIRYEVKPENSYTLFI